jgi:lipopolysaccharide exporter
VTSVLPGGETPPSTRPTLRALDALQRLRASSFTRAVGTLAAGTAASQGVLVLATPILSRLYTDADLGRFGMLMGIAIVAATAVTLRYETSIYLPAEDSDASALLAATLATVALMTLGGTLVMCMVVIALPGWKITTLSWWLPLAVVAGAGNATVITATYWYNRGRQFGRNTALRVAQGVLIASLPIGLHFLGVADGLLWGYLIAQVAVGLYAAGTLRHVWHAHDRAALVGAARKHVSAPKYMLAANLLDTASAQVPIILAGLWFSEATAGHLTLAWRVLAAPMAVLGSAIGQVYYAQTATLWPDARATRVLLTRMWLLLAVIGLIPALVLTTVGPPLFGFFFGSGWRIAGSYASILAVAVLVNFVASPTSAIYLVLGLQRITPWFGVAQLIGRPLAIYVGARYGDMRISLWIWVVTEILIMLTYHGISFRLLRRTERLQRASGGVPPGA